MPCHAHGAASPAALACASFGPLLLERVGHLYLLAELGVLCLQARPLLLTGDQLRPQSSYSFTTVMMCPSKSVFSASRNASRSAMAAHYACCRASRVLTSACFLTRATCSPASLTL